MTFVPKAFWVYEWLYFVSWVHADFVPFQWQLFYWLIVSYCVIAARTSSSHIIVTAWVWASSFHAHNIKIQFPPSADCYLGYFSCALLFSDIHEFMSAWVAYVWVYLIWTSRQLTVNNHLTGWWGWHWIHLLCATYGAEMAVDANCLFSVLTLPLCGSLPTPTLQPYTSACDIGYAGVKTIHLKTNTHS